MQGRDFVDLATQLLAKSSEAAFRTAVSRAYYGAFHVARELVESCGVVLPKTADMHDKLSYCLCACGEEPVEIAGSRLNSLRTERNKADYDLREQKFHKQKNARLQIEIAIRVIQAIEAARAEPVRTQVRSAVRAYASNTLKLSVINK